MKIFIRSHPQRMGILLGVRIVLKSMNLPYGLSVMNGKKKLESQELRNNIKIIKKHEFNT